MTNSILQHPSLNNPDSLLQLCKPLQHLNITYFAHVNIDPSEQFSALCSNPNFLEYYLTNKFYNADIHMAKKNQFGQYAIWDAIDLSGKSQKMDGIASACGVKHVFTIIETDKAGHKDFYHFGTHLNSRSINQVYVTNIDLLRMFILHFKEQVAESKELHSAYDLKFILDNTSTFEFKESEMLDFSRTRNQFLSELNLGKSQYSEMVKQSLIKLNSQLSDEQSKLFGNINLSMREIDCLHLTILGKTAKQIADILKISFRTVEEHLTNIRKKIGAGSKTELIETIIMLLICGRK